MANAAVNGWKERLRIPTYRIGEAASYARVSPQTVSAWHRKDVPSSRAVLSERGNSGSLSFLQLIEMAVVAQMRDAGVKLPEIRAAREDMIRETGLDFPFARLKFKHDGADIFRDVEGDLGQVLTDRLLAHNHGGQYVWADFIQNTLSTFNYDDDGIAVSWRVAGADKEIEIDPRLSFGSPQIHGVKTGIIKSRFVVGEEVDEIAEDFDIECRHVVEALIFEGLEGANPRISKWIN